MDGLLAEATPRRSHHPRPGQSGWPGDIADTPRLTPTTNARFQNEVEWNVRNVGFAPIPVVPGCPAGAAFAAIILAGKEALSRKAETDADDLPLREVLKLPGAGPVADILDARVFAAHGQDRFAYAHRAIGEFVGARRLARQADTPRKERRLLELFGSQPLIPSSLRGIHAWLAWHSPALAPVVIASDPMGLIEYGDADKLTPAEGRALLEALRDLSRENPSFRGWAEYRVAGLAQPALLDELRAAVTSADTEFGVRLLVLEALEGSPLVGRLQQELLQMLLDKQTPFALRSEAGLRLISVDPPRRPPDVLHHPLAGGRLGA